MKHKIYKTKHKKNTLESILNKNISYKTGLIILILLIIVECLVAAKILN